MQSVVFINSHPIQYFAPLYKTIVEQTNINLQVWYCSDETIKGAVDKEFGVTVQWDTPILEGYPYLFFKNNAIKPSLFNGFWGLLNIDLLKALRKQSPSIIIIHGWGYATHLLVILLAKYFGHTVCIRAETPWSQEEQKNPILTTVKHFFLKNLFRRVHYLLFIGKQNKLFYNKLGVSSAKLLFAPYCVHNEFFQAAKRQNNKDAIKSQLGIPASSKVVLFSGKYIEKKRPLDLINAFNLMQHENIFLVMVGDGELKGQMESLIQRYNLQSHVLLTGFINQSLMPAYYAITDVFVMCSGIGETWGLSVNEAMNFGIPIVVSDTTGCSEDLVEYGINGFTFKTGDITALANAIQQCFNFTPDQLANCANKNNYLLNVYDFKTIITSLKKVQTN